MIKIGILIHENEYRFVRCSYLINHLIRLWAKEDFAIIIIKGIKPKPEVDILINHIDLTIIPPEYQEYMDRHPKVINGKIRDISKRHISNHLLESRTTYEGPVIVKPNLNAGGLAEIAKSIPDGLVKLRDQLINQQKNITYSIFNSLSDVPEMIFSNDEFIVEKFLPEVEDDVYYLRVCSFLGDKYVCSRVGSKEPIVKGASVISRELLEPPAEILAYIKERKFDYGKFDFCIHQGEVILFDTNKTPGDSPYNEDNAKILAGGIRAFL
ncbi:MAG: hypothetical protein RLN88_09620 [Ekhidna sp.]|uniref:hypothetical protein n=1 Tax=Ekhidna sp. TaxID=2608089 RepID=UPI0032EFEE3A